MALFQEFKKFVIRGNVVDLAVGFTVGAAFTTVVKSLVTDIIMPPIGLITGQSDFSDKFIILNLPESVELPKGGFQTLSAAQDAGAVTINYGLFLNNCLALAIIAMALFVIIKAVNKIDRELDEVIGATPPSTSEPSDKKCEFCRSTIAYRATRCPHCTSELKTVATPEA